MLVISLMMTFARWYAGAALPANRTVRGGTSSFGFARSRLYQTTHLDRVEQLPLVLVDPLDLHVEQRVGVEGDARRSP